MAQSNSGLSTEQLLELLRRMWLCRIFEETVSDLYASGSIGGLLHLGVGQEAVAVGVSSVLDRGDYLYASHRAHCHALAKGADPKFLLAELAGCANGYCKGKGGSMHVMVKEIGFLGATGVVGGNIPLALGTAFACRAQSQGQVTVVCFGDGAAQTGYFHESLNLASLWNLPVILVCENNGWAEFSPLSAHTKVEHLEDHATIYGMAHSAVDGNDVLAVRGAVSVALDRARSGGGPTLVEALTYRLRGHYVGDSARYRQAIDEEEWKAKDPIRRLQNEFQKQNVDAQRVEQAEQAARAVIRAAADFVSTSPMPEEEELWTDVYA